MSVVGRTPEDPEFEWDIPGLDVIEDRYSSVVLRIKREHRVRTRTAALWLREALKFLDLCADSEDVLAPSKRVDRAWHAFILHTRVYEEYCQARFGSLMHHDPSETEDPVAYQRAYDEMTARFGPLNRRIWPSPYGSDGGGPGYVEGGDGGSCGGGGCGGGGGGG